MPRLKLNLFGSFHAELGDQSLQGFKTNKARAVLAYLAVENGMAHRRARLCNLLWPESDEQRARQNLSQALYNLNRMLGQPELPHLLVQEDTLQFNRLSDHWLDVDEFTSLILDWEAHKHTRLSECQACLERLTKAAELYRGEFLTGFTLRGCQDYDEWIRFHGERFHRMMINALYHLVEALEERGDMDAALRASWKLVSMDALWEQAQRQLIGLLAYSGRREAALAQYRVYQRVLREELGVVPEAETQVLYESLRERRTPSMNNLLHRHNLPAALTAFLGREQELDKLKRLIGDPSSRMLTVTGPGGSGKTRLAIEAALSQVKRFRDGAYLVPLAALDVTQSTPEIVSSAIAAAIAEALSIPLLKPVDAAEWLKDYLRDRQVLLVLDSFEHLVQGSRFIVDLLNVAPGLKVLVTSRVKLNVTVEQHVPLGGMGCPKQGDELESALQTGSVRLFVEAASRAHPGFSISADNIASVGRICELVGGLPLGLLLAAAWLGTFSTEEVAAEIESNLDFLSADWEDVPLRQRSLRATFDYSWGLLNEKEREVLAGLSIFRGGFTRQAAESVVQASAEDLRNLMDKSLLERRLTGRYVMHELLRQYADEKLAQFPEAREAIWERFARYYFAMLIEYGSELNGPRQKDILAQIDLEYSNLKIARKWAMQQWEGSEFNQVLGVMRKYHRLGYRHAEGLRICQDADQYLAQRQQTAELVYLRGELHTWMADYSRQLGRPEDTPAHLELARSFLEQAAAGGVDARSGLALYWFIRGQSESVLDAQRDAFAQSLEIGRELDDEMIEAQASLFLGVALSRKGKYEDALRFQMESLELFRGLEDQTGIAQALVYISFNQISHGEHELSYQSMVSAAELFRKVGNLAEAGEALRGLGLVLSWNGRFAEGADLLEQSLPLLRESANLQGLVYALTVLGVVRMHLCDDTSARAFLNEAQMLAQRSGYWREYATALFGFGCIELAAGDYRRAKIYYEQSITRYRSLQYLGELGWSLGGLALVLQAMGQREQAWNYLKEGLQIVVQTHSMAPMLTCSLAAPLLLIDVGQMGAALEIYSAAKNLPSVSNSLWAERVCGGKIASASATLDEDTRTAIRERGSALDPAAAAAKALAALEAAYE